MAFCQGIHPCFSWFFEVVEWRRIFFTCASSKSKASSMVNHPNRQKTSFLRKKKWFYHREAMTLNEATTCTYSFFLERQVASSNQQTRGLSAETNLTIAGLFAKLIILPLVYTAHGDGEFRMPFALSDPTNTFLQ
jgi:hypothetical protein